MDINNQTAAPVAQPAKPVEWTWIAQRKATDDKTPSLWKFGFIAPDGASVRVTFHEVGKSGEDSAATDAGMPDPTDFAPPGHPITDETQDSTFYVTFFSNRHPEFFMKWDTGLSHEDSLVVWVTITYGIVDFVRKAKPANVILDDLSNGKLKMVLRSVAMDVAAANPEYQLEQTQKHHYRSFFQIKKTGSGSAFADNIQGKSAEGETTAPDVPSPVNDPQQPAPANSDSDPQSQAISGSVDGDKNEDATIPQPKDRPGFASTQPVPIKQTPLKRKNLTVEIGKDYSIAVRDKDGNVIDRYRGKNPGDILRWINVKGFGTSRMVVVDKEQPSIKKDKKKQPETKVEQYEIDGQSIFVNTIIPAKQAALMNYIVNAETVRCLDERVEFIFATDKDMPFKQALVELAFEQTNQSETK